MKHVTHIINKRMFKCKKCGCFWNPYKKLKCPVCGCPEISDERRR